VGGHHTAAQVLQGGWDLRLEAAREDVLPVGPSELSVSRQGLA
jgi:hypothetical protein